MNKTTTNNIKMNTFRNLKFGLIVLLFNILPIIFVFIGLVYSRVLEIQTEDINLKIENELQEMSILEKENILNDLYKEKDIVEAIISLKDILKGSSSSSLS